MSWDKQTINLSKLDAVRDTLEEVGVPFRESVIATFRGAGCNDPDYEMYDLKRLAYRDTVILEYVTMDSDCDANDYIQSIQFDLKDEPKHWAAVRMAGDGRCGRCGASVNNAEFRLCMPCFVETRPPCERNLALGGRFYEKEEA